MRLDFALSIGIRSPDCYTGVPIVDDNGAKSPA
jgi:hypothetical protein